MTGQKPMQDHEASNKRHDYLLMLRNKRDVKVEDILICLDGIVAQQLSEGGITLEQFGEILTLGAELRGVDFAILEMGA